MDVRREVQRPRHFSLGDAARPRIGHRKRCRYAVGREEYVFPRGSGGCRLIEVEGECVDGEGRVLDERLRAVREALRRALVGQSRAHRAYLYVASHGVVVVARAFERVLVGRGETAQLGELRGAELRYVALRALDRHYNHRGHLLGIVGAFAGRHVGVDETALREAAERAVCPVEGRDELRGVRIRRAGEGERQDG